MNEKYILAYDLGTTGNEAALLDFKLNIINHAKVEYPLYYPEKGCVEQETEDYWNSVKKVNSILIQENKVNPKDIKALVFDCQMNCTVPVDNTGNPLMRCINWLDVRAADLIRRKVKGLIKISGFGLRKLLKFIKVTGGAPGTNGKDPISHILWIKENEPEIYKDTYKFLSVKDYVIFKSTENAVTSRDLGHTSWLMDSNPGNFYWSDKILKTFKINKEKLPEIHKSTEIAGKLTEKSAQELGLEPKIPIIVGSGDLIASAIGSGAQDNQIVVSLGTADWVASLTDKRLKDLLNYTGSICSVQDKYLCISKQETGAACLNWIIDQMFQKEKELYKDNLNQLYNHLDKMVETTDAGSKNLLFTPWMLGERSPLNDSNVRAGFYNLSLDHNKADILRAVYEGVAFNIKWALTVVEKLIGVNNSLNFIGGGAKSNIWCQILADITEREIKQVENPNLSAIRGSAIIALIGLGLFDNFAEINSLIKIKKTYQPDVNNRNIYNKLFAEFLKIYKRNKKMFNNLNL
ncbi:MAG: FGGY-family carbohydrate kinase [Promethearchaeota archaeon]